MEELFATLVETSSLGQWLYSSLTTTFLPVSVARVAYRAYMGRDTFAALLERLGTSSKQRPAGPVIWFHAANTSESAVALPVIFRCLLDYNENVHVLLTTASAEAQALLSNTLPSRVILQYIPLENPACVHAFLQRWKPQVGIFMESELRPNLVLAASSAGVKLALLNARLPNKMFLRWHSWRILRSLMRQMISSFSLIIPQSDVDVGRFRMMGATLQQMPGWCADLKYASAMGHSLWHMWKPSPQVVQSVKQDIAGRHLWLAVNIHEGEEAAVAKVHTTLKKDWPNILTLLLPRPTSRCGETAAVLKGEGLKVGMWSDSPRNFDVDVMLVDNPSELPLLYSVCDLVFVGNSLMEGGTGHSFAEAAVAGCAVLVGEHCGHFSSMADELNQAAVLAAEEAAAAVTSSGPLNDEYMDAFTSSAPGAQHNSSGTPRVHTPVPPPPTPHAASPSAAAGGWSSSTAAQFQEASRPATAPARMAGTDASFEFASTITFPGAPLHPDVHTAPSPHPSDAVGSGPSSATSLQALLSGPVQLRFAAPPSSNAAGPGQQQGVQLGTGRGQARLRPLVPYRAMAGDGSGRGEDAQLLQEQISQDCSTAPDSPADMPRPATAERLSSPMPPSHLPTHHTTTTFPALSTSHPYSQEDSYSDPMALESPWSCKEPGPYQQYWLTTANISSTTMGPPPSTTNNASSTSSSNPSSRVDWHHHHGHHQPNHHSSTPRGPSDELHIPSSPGMHVDNSCQPCSVLSMPPSSWSPGGAACDGNTSPDHARAFAHAFLRPAACCSSPETSPSSGISTGLLRPSPLIAAPFDPAAPPPSRVYPPRMPPSLPHGYSPPPHLAACPFNGSATVHQLLLDPSTMFPTTSGPLTHPLLQLHQGPSDAAHFTTLSISNQPAPTSPSAPARVLPSDILYSPESPSLYHWVASSPAPSAYPASPLNSIGSAATFSPVPWTATTSSPPQSHLHHSSQNITAVTGSSGSGTGSTTQQAAASTDGAAAASRDLLVAGGGGSSSSCTDTAGCPPPPLLFAYQHTAAAGVRRPLDFSNKPEGALLVLPKQSGLNSAATSDILSPYHPSSDGGSPRAPFDLLQEDLPEWDADHRHRRARLLAGGGLSDELGTGLSDESAEVLSDDLASSPSDESGEAAAGASDAPAADDPSSSSTSHADLAAALLGRRNLAVRVHAASGASGSAPAADGAGAGVSGSSSSCCGGAAGGGSSAELSQVLTCTNQHAPADAAFGSSDSPHLGDAWDGDSVSSLHSGPGPASLLPAPQACTSPMAVGRGDVQQEDKPGHRWMPTEVSFSEWEGVSPPPEVLTLDRTQHNASPGPAPMCSPPSLQTLDSPPNSPPLIGEGTSYSSPSRRWARRRRFNTLQQSPLAPRDTPPDSPSSLSFDRQGVPHDSSSMQPHPNSRPHSRFMRSQSARFAHPPPPTEPTTPPPAGWDHLPAASSTSPRAPHPAPHPHPHPHSACDQHPGSQSPCRADPTTRHHTYQPHSSAQGMGSYSSMLGTAPQHTSGVAGSGAGSGNGSVLSLPLRRLRSPVIGSPRAAAANLVMGRLMYSNGNTEDDEEVYAPLRLGDRRTSSSGWHSGSARHARSVSPVPRSPFSAVASLRVAHAHSGVSEDGDAIPNWLSTPTPTSTARSTDTGLHLFWRNTSSVGGGPGSYTAPNSARPTTADYSMDGTMEAETPSVAGMKPHAGAGGRQGAAGTSYMRYAGEYILPATHLPYLPHGPAVWKVSGESGLADAIATLWREPLERRSRGHAAAQAAAKLASGLVSTVWHFLDDIVITPALQDYVKASGQDPIHSGCCGGGSW